MVYVGSRMKLSSLITRPKNSIVQQSVDAIAYTPGLATNHLRNHEVNADGFGISWYDALNKPHTYRSTKPAWSDQNLSTLCNNIETSLTLAHVRAATPGLEVNEQNCHPFTFKNLTFMHNGGIGGFTRLKRPMSELFPDKLWHNIKGSTDSEYCFHYFLTHLFRHHKDYDRTFSLQEIEEALRQTIDGLQDLQKKYGSSAEQSASMNFCVSDGKVVVASRMRRPIEEDSPSLFYGSGSGFHYDEESQFFRFGGGPTFTTCTTAGKQATIISSEPLNKVEDDWQVVPEETLISVAKDGVVSLNSLM